MNWRRLKCDFDIALALSDEPPAPPIPPRQILNQDLTRAYYARVQRSIPMACRRDGVVCDHGTSAGTAAPRTRLNRCVTVTPGQSSVRNGVKGRPSAL